MFTHRAGGGRYEAAHIKRITQKALGGGLPTRAWPLCKLLGRFRQFKSVKRGFLHLRRDGINGTGVCNIELLYLGRRDV